MSGTEHSMFTLLEANRGSAVGSLDSEGYIVYANAAFSALCREIAGGTNAEGDTVGAIGSRFVDSIPERDKNLWRQTITHGITGAVQSAVLIWHTSTGDRYLEVSFTPVEFDLVEEGAQVFLTIRDVTGLYQTERRVTQLASRFQAVLESSVDLNASIQDPQEIYRAMRDKLTAAIDFDTGTIQILDGDYLRVVEHFGFAVPEALDTLRFPLDQRFPNARVVTGMRSLALADIRNDFPHFLTEEGQYESGQIRSWLGVPIIDRGEVWGMVTLDRNRVDPFDSEDIELATAIANHAGVAISNSRLFAGLERANAIQSTLTRELHHRVKNNMQLVSSLIAIREEHADAATRELLSEVRSKIVALAAVHESLYVSPTLDSIELRDYLRRVADEIDFSRDPQTRAVGVQIDILESIRIHIDTAIPLGLILSELLLNAIKHAFPSPSDIGGDTPIVRIVGERSSEDPPSIRLQVIDNGVGIEVKSLPTDSFGMIVIRTLADQIGATIAHEKSSTISSFGPGTVWNVTIPDGGTNNTEKEKV